jgi:hypothetical protein
LWVNPTNEGESELLESTKLTSGGRSSGNILRKSFFDNRLSLVLKKLSGYATSVVTVDALKDRLPLVD